MSKNRYNGKIVVFDLDETLGNFVELGMFWDALKDFYGGKLSENHFFDVVDLFSDFLRPNIITILKFLIEKKRNGKCDKLMIYTNNQGPTSWVRMISRYFDSKLGEKTFDRIISAFKVHGKQIEICRTSHDKSVKDLVRCTKIEPTAEICFLDDQYHPLMKHNNVFYINVKPYIFSMPFRDMAEKYYHANSVSNSKEEFITKIEKNMNRYDYEFISKDSIEQDIDIIVSKKIMHHLEEFFSREQATKRAKTYKRRKDKKRSDGTMKNTKK